MYQYVIPNGTYHFPVLSRGTTLRETRYRTFSHGCCFATACERYMKSMKARVAERGQVTIPKRLRERLGVKPGTVQEFSEEHVRLIAVKSGGPIRSPVYTDGSVRRSTRMPLWRSFAADDDHCR